MKKYLILALAISLLSCGEQAKQQEKPSDAAAAKAEHSAGGVTWQAPAEWVQETPSSGMRKAQYRIPKVASDPEDASLVVFYFGGEGGGVQANIDRWCSQIAQDDGRASKDVAKIETATANSLKQTLVDVSGTYLSRARPMAGDVIRKPDYRMLAAVVETSNGPWFFKLVGPAQTVSHAEASFRTFLASIKAPNMSAGS